MERKLIAEGLEFCETHDACEGCPLQNTPQFARECQLMAAGGMLIRNLRADLERERGARRVVDATVRSLVRENGRLKERVNLLMDLYDPVMVQIADGDEVRQISAGALLELLRARDDGRLLALPAEDM